MNMNGLNTLTDIPHPTESIYYYMYTCGLKGIDLDLLLDEVGKTHPIREKDIENYWNGYHNRQLYHTPQRPSCSLLSLHPTTPSKLNTFQTSNYSDYPLLANAVNGLPEIQNRWVPCNHKNKPLIKWGQGCMTKASAESLINCKYLAENIKGTRMLVVDCDGDHSEQLDLDTINFLYQFTHQTHTLFKPKRIEEYKDYEQTNDTRSASFHLTFAIDRVIPTMHHACHIDFIGNKENSLRYLKNKWWNNLDPMPMTDEIWNKIKGYIVERSTQLNGQNNQEQRNKV
jgi:hypothetical protein